MPHFCCSPPKDHKKTDVVFVEVFSVIGFHVCQNCGSPIDQPVLNQGWADMWINAQDLIIEELNLDCPGDVDRIVWLLYPSWRKGPPPLPKRSLQHSPDLN